MGVWHLRCLSVSLGKAQRERSSRKLARTGWKMLGEPCCFGNPGHPCGRGLVVISQSVPRKPWQARGLQRRSNFETALCREQEGLADQKHLEYLQCWDVCQTPARGIQNHSSTKQESAGQRLCGCPEEPSGCWVVRFALSLCMWDSSMALGRPLLPCRQCLVPRKQRIKSPPGPTGGQWNPKSRYLSRLSVQCKHVLHSNTEAQAPASQEYAHLFLCPVQKFAQAIFRSAYGSFSQLLCLEECSCISFVRQLQNF